MAGFIRSVPLIIPSTGMGLVVFDLSEPLGLLSGISSSWAEISAEIKILRVCSKFALNCGN